MIATVLIWATSMFLLIVAAICYVPLLCYIRGNLKVSGYLTSMFTRLRLTKIAIVGIRLPQDRQGESSIERESHRLEKLSSSSLQRIAELIRRKQRQRLKRNMLLEKQLAEGAPIKNKNGQVLKGVQQPTIPVVAFDDSDEDMRMGMNKGLAAGGGTRTRPKYKHSPSDGNLTGNGYPPDQKYHPQPRRECWSCAPNGWLRAYRSVAVAGQFSTHSGNELFDGSYPPTLDYGYQEPGYTEPGRLYGGNYPHGSSTHLMADAAPPGMAPSMPSLEPQQSYEYQHYLRPDDTWEQYPSPQIPDYAPIQHPYPPPPPRRHSGLAYDDPADEIDTLPYDEPHARHTITTHRF